MSTKLGGVSAARSLGLRDTADVTMASNLADVRMLMLEGRNMEEACGEVGISTSAYREHRTRLSDPWRIASTIYESRARDMLLDMMLREVGRIMESGTASERIRIVDRLIPALMTKEQGNQVNVAVMPAVMERYPHVTREQAMRVLRDDIGTRVHAVDVVDVEVADGED